MMLFSEIDLQIKYLSRRALSSSNGGRTKSPRISTSLPTGLSRTATHPKNEIAVVTIHAGVVLESCDDHASFSIVLLST